MTDILGIILSTLFSFVICYLYVWLAKKGISFIREYRVDPDRMEEAIEILENRSEEAQDD